MSISATPNDDLGDVTAAPCGEPTSVTEVPLTSLILDPGYNARVDGNHAEHVSRLLESDPADWPPILVTKDDQGRLFVLDGNHRIAAATHLGLASLPCRIIEGGGYIEAFEANQQHGLPLSVDDRKEYALWLNKNEPGLSLREMGRRCGLHHATVKTTLESATHDESTGTDPEPQSVITSRPKPPVADRLVSLVLRATDDKEGIGFLGRDKRASVIRKVIKEYEKDAQVEIAEAVHAWGAAMQAAAEPFLAEE